MKKKTSLKKALFIGVTAGLPLFLLACFDSLSRTAQVADSSGLSEPQAILPKLHVLNLQEIQAGQAASSKACSEAVRSYAQALLADHESADQQVERLASAHSTDLEDVRFSPEEQQAVDSQAAALQKLAQMTGGAGLDGTCEFDRPFVDAMVQAHQFALSVVKEALDSSPAPTPSPSPSPSEPVSMSASGDDVMEFLKATEAKLQEHLDRALSLQSSLGNPGKGQPQSQTPAQTASPSSAE